MPKLHVQRDGGAVIIAVRVVEEDGASAILELTARGAAALWPVIRAAAEDEDDTYDSELVLVGDLTTTPERKMH